MIVKTKHFPVILKWVNDMSDISLDKLFFLHEYMNKQNIEKIKSILTKCTIELLKQFLELTNNTYNASDLQCLILTCYIISLKLVLQHDHYIPYKIQKYLKFIKLNEKTRCTTTDITRLEREILESTDYLGCYNTQIMNDLLPPHQISIKDLLKIGT